MAAEHQFLEHPITKYVQMSIFWSLLPFTPHLHNFVSFPLVFQLVGKCFIMSRSEFETLPLLRSTFFHYGLGLARSEGLLQATVNTDNRGEANIYLNSQVGIPTGARLTSTLIVR